MRELGFLALQWHEMLRPSVKKYERWCIFQFLFFFNDALSTREIDARISENCSRSRSLLSIP